MAWQEPPQADPARPPFPWVTALDGLPLLHPTSAGWSHVALSRLDHLLSDHAHCEQKAASAALSLIARCPADHQLVRSMLTLAQEELRHFRQVHELIRRRGGSLGRPSPDRYVRELRRRGFQHKGGIGPVADLLLLNSLIEARSCERLRLLAEGLECGEGELAATERQQLSSFYRDLAEAEGRHWELFACLARGVSEPAAVDRRLQELATVEAAIIETLPFEPRMH
jgi:tRNA-(ms[2]io[6]A)-hydroxylase